MDDLERKLALQDQLLGRVKVEQETAAVFPQLSSNSGPRSPMEFDDRDRVLDHAPSLRRKRMTANLLHGVGPSHEPSLIFKKQTMGSSIGLRRPKEQSRGFSLTLWRIPKEKNRLEPLD